MHENRAGTFRLYQEDYTMIKSGVWAMNQLESIEKSELVWSTMVDEVVIDAWVTACSELIWGAGALIWTNLIQLYHIKLKKRRFFLLTIDEYWSEDNTPVYIICNLGVEEKQIYT